MSNPLQCGALFIGALCGFLGSVFWVDPAVSAEGSHLLDGMTFVGNNGEKGRELDPDEHEEMVFEDGRFKSVSCDPYDFGDSAYSTTVQGNAIHFEAVTTSPTHGKIAWQGTVEGGTALVTFSWTKKRWYWDTHREYWFKGKLKE